MFGVMASAYCRGLSLAVSSEAGSHRSLVAAHLSVVQCAPPPLGCPTTAPCLLRVAVCMSARALCAGHADAPAYVPDELLCGSSM